MPGSVTGGGGEVGTAADVIARRLAAAGCRYAFGIPGGEVLALMEALRAAGIRTVLTKHENPAGFMAEGTWHATGAPGILIATIGPGLANAVNVIANAVQDKVPLIVLSGCVEPAGRYSYTHQVIDHAALLRPIVKASFQAEPGAVAQAVDKALALALDGRPGPVHLDLPVTLAAQPEADPGFRTVPVAPAAPASGPALAQARQALAGAERPLIVAGLDVVVQGAAGPVAAFARRFGIPVVTTYKAKGVLPEDDPLCLGGAGLSPRADKQILPLLRAADCVLLLGYDPVEMRAGWTAPFGPEQTVIELSAARDLHGMHHPTVGFVGDIAATLAALTDGLVPRPTWPDGRPAAVRAALRDAFAPTSAWGPAAVFATARAVLPAETVITADSGAHRILLSQMWECPAPRTLLQSSGFCTMGCAVPLAAGHRLADPSRPVVAFVGDAGLEMTLGELATLRDLALPVIVVVLVDASLALIELKQRGMQLPNSAVDFGETDFAAVARALGGHGATVADADSLAGELRAALDRPGFTVIAARIGQRAYDGLF